MIFSLDFCDYSVQRYLIFTGHLNLFYACLATAAFVANIYVDKISRCLQSNSWVLLKKTVFRCCGSRSWCQRHALHDKCDHAPEWGETDLRAQDWPSGQSWADGTGNCTCIQIQREGLVPPVSFKRQKLLQYKFDWPRWMLQVVWRDNLFRVSVQFSWLTCKFCEECSLTWI